MLVTCQRGLLILRNVSKTSPKIFLTDTTLKCLNCHRLVSNNPASKIAPSDEQKEVYYGVLTPQIRGVKMFSLLTSTAGIVAQPLLYQQVTALGGGMPIMIAVGSFMGFFTFVTPFLLHLITKKYVTKIDYHSKEDTYSLTTLSFFLKPKTIKFKPEEVEVPDIPGMFTTFCVKGKPVFVDARLFPDAQHYIRIMGFDKPIDFKLGTSESLENKDGPVKK